MEVKKLLYIRNLIQDECEKMMVNLSDSALFLPQLAKIEEYLMMLDEAKMWITVRSMDESRISECLCYLIDLFLVISKYDLNLTKIKNIGQQALQLISDWREAVNIQVISDGNDYKSEIQEVLREHYPMHFGVKRAFRNFSPFST